MILKLYAVKQDNAGNPVSHYKLRHDLLSVAGGYTEYNAIGSWKDKQNNRIYNDPVVVYEIVSHGLNISECVDVFETWGEQEAKQESLFYTINGEGYYL